MQTRSSCSLELVERRSYLESARAKATLKNMIARIEFTRYHLGTQWYEDPQTKTETHPHQIRLVDEDR